MHPVAAFAVSRTLVVAGTVVGARWFAPGISPPTAWKIPETLLQPFFRWDAAYQRSIWLHGYFPASGSVDVAHRAGFFPLYPLLVRAVGIWPESSDWAALIISNVAFLLALLLVFRLAMRYFEPSRAALSIWLLAVWPWSCFFSYPYAESLELLLIALTFWLMENRHWVWAGAAGALAAFSRPTGIALVAAFLPELFAGGGKKSLRMKIPILAGTLLVPIGLITFALVLLSQTGDPLGYAHAQALWVGPHRNPFFPVGALLRLITRHSLFENEAPGVLVFLAFALTVVWAFRRLPLRYGAFGAAFLLMTTASAYLFIHSFVSLPRHTLEWFPAFFAFASMLTTTRRWFIPGLWLATSATLLFLYSGLYASWHFVG